MSQPLHVGQNDPNTQHNFKKPEKGVCKHCEQTIVWVSTVKQQRWPFEPKEYPPRLLPPEARYLIMASMRATLASSDVLRPVQLPHHFVCPGLPPVDNPALRRIQIQLSE